MKYKITPWNHQLKTIEECTDRDTFALFYEQGTGKTLTAVNLLRQKCNQRRKILRTLILCPLIVTHQWEEEIKNNSNLGDYIQILSGNSEGRCKKLDAHIPKRGKQVKHIFITNHETISMGETWRYIAGLEWDVLIVDESHRFKAFNGKRAQALHFFAQKVRYKFLLTGTPMPNSPMDIWGQYMILDPKIFTDNFYAFRARYFYDKLANANVNFPDFQFIKGMEKDLNKKIYSCAHRVMKADVLDLPPLTYQVVNVELSTKQKKIYKEMKNDLVAFLDGEACVADLALTKALRLQQMLCGIFKTDEGEVKLIDNNRDKVLTELLNDLIPTGQKIIIWSTFRESYKVIGAVCKKLKIIHTFLTGEQKAAEKFQAVDDFNNKNAQVIIANPAAGGTGVELTSGTIAIYYSRSFNLEHRLQSEARNYRGGQVKPCTIIDMVVRDSMDDYILQALKNKEKISESILAFR